MKNELTKNNLKKVLNDMNIYIGEFKEKGYRILLESDEQVNDIKEIILQNYIVETDDYNIDDEYRFLDYLCRDILDIDGYVYSDEVFYCEICNKYEFNDNGYVNNYTIINDCEIVCVDCLKNNIEEYIDYYINNSNKAIPFIPYKLINSEEWKEIDNVFTNEKPIEVLENLNNIYDEVVFYISYITPFEIEYKALYRVK